jgi:hypothetical protein
MEPDGRPHCCKLNGQRFVAHWLAVAQGWPFLRLQLASGAPEQAHFGAPHAPLWSSHRPDSWAPSATALHVCVVPSHVEQTGQSALTLHATQLPLPSHTPPVHDVPSASFDVWHIPALHVTSWQAGGGAQSEATSHWSVQAPIASQNFACESPEVHAVPASAGEVPHAPVLVSQSGTRHDDGDEHC